MQPATKLKLRIFLFVLIVIVVIAFILLRPFLLEKLKWALYTEQERIDILNGDTSATPLKIDSVQVTKGKIPKSEFESQYTVDEWHREFKANKVAFDRNYNNYKIDVIGTITRISNDDGCAKIEMRAESGIYDKIIFTNCPFGKDKWADEVINVSVGEQVHIRGVYIGSMSDNYELVVVSSHVITD